MGLESSKERPLLLTWSPTTRNYYSRRGLGHSFSEGRQRIHNANYRRFIDTGMIETISEDQLKRAMDNVTGRRGRYVEEGRALLAVLYYTGARPNEVLALRGKDVEKEGNYLKLFLRGSKGGLPRPVFLKLNKKPVQEIYKHAHILFPEVYVFYHYRNKYTRTVKTRKGIIKRDEISTMASRYVKRWFTGVIPDSISAYYLRHNRFSKLALAGASFQELRMIKGSRSEKSIVPYLHLSTKTSKDIAKKID